MIGEYAADGRTDGRLITMASDAWLWLYEDFRARRKVWVSENRLRVDTALTRSQDICGPKFAPWEQGSTSGVAIYHSAGSS